MYPATRRTSGAARSDASSVRTRATTAPPPARETRGARARHARSARAEDAERLDAAWADLRVERRAIVRGRPRDVPRDRSPERARRRLARALERDAREARDREEQRHEREGRQPGEREHDLGAQAERSHLSSEATPDRVDNDRCVLITTFKCNK
jgi:hypothetical protein